MVRKKFYGFDLEFAEEFPGSFHIFIRIVAAGDKWNPDLDFRSPFRKKAEIVQNALIALTGQFPVFGGVRVFEIDKESVSDRQDCFECRTRNEAAGIQGCMQSDSFELFQQFQTELRLKERFSSRKCHTPAGLFVKNPVLQRHCDSFFRCDPFSIEPECSAETCRFTEPAYGTGAPLEVVFVSLH